jgi:mono/diheme cytochrome c family protein
MRGHVRTTMKHAALWLSLSATPLFGQNPAQPALQLDTGKHIYKAACAACHGQDGRGTPKAIRGFEAPRTFPDFTQCGQTTPETNIAWEDTIVHGGPARGFSEIMPAFGEALTEEQIGKVIKYLRSLCRNPRWPRGELNLPRALVTEKAYPENEAVISTAVNANGTPGISLDLIHEQRFGEKNQIEIAVPLNFEDQNHTWYGGVGDTVFGVKRTFFSSLRTGSIFALQGEISVPTGNKARGFGSGTTAFETFASFGQLFPTNTFIQFQTGAGLPVDTEVEPRSVFWHTAVGQTFAANHGLGRMWSPMVEFLGERELATGAKTNWDILPEMQVTLSRRQHIRLNLGVQVPANNTRGRPVQVLFYVLWDWADGRLNEGW